MTETTEANTFWMVWREGSYGCSFKHHSRQSADDEAKRLAKHSPGHRFFVLKTASAFEAPIAPLTRVKMLPPKEPGHELDYEVPF